MVPSGPRVARSQPLSAQGAPQAHAAAALARLRGSSRPPRAAPRVALPLAQALLARRPLVTRVGGGDGVERPAPWLRTRAVMRALVDRPGLARLPTFEWPARVDRPGPAQGEGEGEG